MTLRFTLAGCCPSASAAFQPPAYQAQDTPLALSVSPMVFAVCGGTGSPAAGTPCGLASSGVPPSAGGTPLGWYGGCEVLTDQPSGVTCPPPALKTCTAASLADGEPGFFSSLPAASSRARIAGAASACCGAQAQIRYWWLR